MKTAADIPPNTHAPAWRDTRARVRRVRARLRRINRLRSLRDVRNT